MSGLETTQLDPDPIVQLQRWLADAAATGMQEPAAMCVATVAADAGPSARMVLARGLDERGIRFYTSYFSRKGRELAGNSSIAALFYWRELERQVRLEGTARVLDDDESDAYFASRPRGHRISAWASEQSDAIETFDILAERFAHFEQRFAGEEVPRPHSWGGYLIVPERLEFWQARANRMHDRFEYVRAGTAWQIGRLQP